MVSIRRVNPLFLTLQRPWNTDQLILKPITLANLILFHLNYEVLGYRYLKQGSPSVLYVFLVYRSIRVTASPSHLTPLLECFVSGMIMILRLNGALSISNSLWETLPSYSLVPCSLSILKIIRHPDWTRSILIFLIG